MDLDWYVVVPLYAIALIEFALVVRVNFVITEVRQSVKDAIEDMPVEVVELINEELAGGLVGYAGRGLRSWLESMGEKEKAAKQGEQTPTET